MRNVAFIGRRGSGKSTLVKMLTESAAYVRFSWAEPVRQIASMAYGEIDKAGTYTIRAKCDGACNCADGRTRKVTGTWLLQRIGTDALREQVDQDFWVKAGERYLDGSEVEQFGYRWANDDTRFENELATLRRRGWLTIGLAVEPDAIRDRLTARDGSFDPSSLDHPSERLPVEAADIVIEATGPLREVFTQVRSLLDLPISV